MKTQFCKATGASRSPAKDEWAQMLQNQEQQAQRVDNLVSQVKSHVMRTQYGKSQYLAGMAQREMQRESERQEGLSQKRKQEKSDAWYAKEINLVESEERDKRMNISMYNSTEIRRRRQDSKRDKVAERAYNRQLEDEEWNRVNNREQLSKRLRFEWRKMLETGYDEDVNNQKQRASKEREERIKAGVHMKNLGDDYIVHNLRQQHASNKIDRRSHDLTQAIDEKLAAKKNYAQEAMTLSQNTITDTSFQNLESLKLKKLRASHKPITLKDLAKLSEQQKLARTPNQGPNLVTDDLDGDQADYKDTQVQKTKLWSKIEASLKKEKRDSQVAYRQILDEQLMHRDFLGKQGDMTRTEKGFNKIRPDGEHQKIEEIQKASMVPGFHNEYPLQNVAISQALQQAVSSFMRGETVQNSLRENSQSDGGLQAQGDAQSTNADDYDPLLEIGSHKPIHIDGDQQTGAPPSVIHRSQSPQSRTQPHPSERSEPHIKSHLQQTMTQFPPAKINQKRVKEFNQTLRQKQNISIGKNSVYGTGIRRRSRQDEASAVTFDSRLSMNLSRVSQANKPIGLDSLFQAGVKKQLQNDAESHSLEVGRWQNKSTRGEEPKDDSETNYYQDGSLESNKYNSANVSKTVLGKKNRMHANASYVRRSFNNSVNFKSPSVRNSADLFAPPQTLPVETTYGREQKQSKRLAQLGMDTIHARHSLMNSFKGLDQMGERDIFDDKEVAQPSHQKYQKQRAQLLPLGGMLGERVAKSMSIYGQNYNPTTEMPGKNRKSQALKLAEKVAAARDQSQVLAENDDQ